MSLPKPEITSPFCPAYTPEQLAQLIQRGRLRLAPEGIEKFCPRCQDWHPADSEFYNLRERNCDQLESWCRCCKIESLSAISRIRGPRLAA